jgi:hypothetical protein
MLWQSATGGITSSTVTLAGRSQSCCCCPVTVSVTVFVPTSEQPKLFGVTLRLAMPQASTIHCPRQPAVMLPLPEASNCSVMFWQTAVGGMVSSTVTVAVQVRNCCC